MDTEYLVVVYSKYCAYEYSFLLSLLLLLSLLCLVGVKGAAYALKSLHGQLVYSNSNNNCNSNRNSNNSKTKLINKVEVGVKAFNLNRRSTKFTKQQRDNPSGEHKAVRGSERERGGGRVCDIDSSDSRKSSNNSSMSRQQGQQHMQQ